MENKIKSFEEACKALNIPESLPEVSNLPEKHQKALVANYKLIIICQALNEGWEPNWNDHDERKYYPWFDVEANKENPSGVGLSYYGCCISFSGSYVSSRLCVKTYELAEYLGKTFTELYKEYFLL